MLLQNSRVAYKRLFPNFIFSELELTKDRDLVNLCYESINELFPLNGVSKGMMILLKSKVWRIISEKAKVCNCYILVNSNYISLY